ncbi:plasmid recombination protein [Marinobacter salinisoli]|uniref:Plasmid recombination protein n=1 Tax=Marinobacter salinisoli TaxID=2769486 RepID=A0ABX7MP17_9GAMM|nr:plasmid recombination protein [Marinobacter salinisoli]QSP94003.1 plasmid recombination protein [Marinobacter salinisoli]
MSTAVSTRVKPLSVTKAGGDRKHDLRSGQQPGYIDGSRTCNNSTIVPYRTPGELKKLCQQRRIHRTEHHGTTPPGRLRKDASVAISGIITFGRDVQQKIRDLPVKEQDRLYLRAAKSVARRLKTRVAGLVVHRDEASPHAHYILEGYDLHGAPVSKKLTRGMLSSLQDVIVPAYEHLGITRGEKIGVRIARGDDPSTYINRSVHQLHHDLPKEIKEMEQKLEDNVQEREKSEAELNSLKLDIENLEKKHEKSEIKLNSIDREIETKEQAVEALTKQFGSACKQAKKGMADLEALKKNKAKIKKRTETYENRLNKALAELEQLAGMAKDVPEPEEILVAKASDSVLRKYDVDVTPKKYVPHGQLTHWYGAVMHMRNKAYDKVRDYKTENEELKEELELMHRVANQLIHDTARPDSLTKAPKTIANDMVDALSVPYYGVIMKISPKIVGVLPQQQVTNRQKAAALYRASREKWKDKGLTTYRVQSDDTAKEIILMAIEDAVDMTISFDNQKYQELLINTVIKAKKEGWYGEVQAKDRPAVERSKDPREAPERTPAHNFPGLPS